MKAVLVTALITLAALGFLNQPTAASDEPLLLVTDKDAHLLYFIDAENYEIIGTVKTGRGPQEVVVTPDYKTAIVSNFGDNRSTVSVIDIDDMLKIKDIETKPYYRPHGMAVSSDGKLLYVTCEGNKVVAEIDIATGKVLRGLQTHEKLSHMLTLAPDEKTLYVANSEYGNVSYIGLVKGVRSGSIASGKGSQGIAISPDGLEVWVANRHEGTIAIINTETKKRSEKVDCPGYPLRIKFTPDGARVLVTCAAHGVVNVFDAESHESIDIIQTGKEPVGIDVTPDAKLAFTVNFADRSVSVIDLDKSEVIKTIPVGMAPYGIVYVPADATR